MVVQLAGSHEAGNGGQVKTKNIVGNSNLPGIWEYREVNANKYMQAISQR